ncbi:MAG: hypothetical protein LUH82_06655 [Clostridiales bacterium]|nr:hypothetical protein [Clostridiales bacterium]
MKTQAKVKQKKTLQSTYATGGAGEMLDREILELVLEYAAPGCRAKSEAQKMLEGFGSLENIFNSGQQQFCQMSGLGDSAAVLFSLISRVPGRIMAQRNAGVTHIKNAEQAKIYFGNMLYEETIEKIILMCLNEEKRILSCRVVSDGTVNLSEVSMQKAMYAMSNIDTRFAMLAHNHPRGRAQPSAKDIKFTVKAREMFGQMGIKLIDHIIVGESETISLNSIARFKKYFTESCPDADKGAER